MGRRLGQWVFVFSILTGLVSSPVYASSRACSYALQPVHAVTLKSLRESNTAHLLEFERNHPLPSFDDLKTAAKNEQVGEIGPRALQQLLGPDESFVSTPAPTSVADVAVNLVDEGRSFPIHVDVETAGHRTSTAAYLTLPRAVKAHEGPYMIGAEYPVLVVSLHGGGTPGANGGNGVSIGKALTPHGIPVLTMDIPGHGRATRQVDGLTTFREMAEWVLKVVDKIVDPNVKIVLTGHSWGGEFAVYMRQLSREPRFARISRYVALSPPVDISLGGDAKKKIEFEEWYQKNLEDFKAKIAPSDFEFQSNILSNGKVSDVGSYFTTFTNLDYATPPLTPENQEGLRPLTLVVGDADGLVYVGREKAFQEAFGGLSGDSQYILLGPGTTWKSKKPDDVQPTGHNIWDRYNDGTTQHQVYKLIADLALKEVPGGAIDAGPKPDMAVQRVDEIFRNYANFFLFRQFIKAHDEYVLAPTRYQSTVTRRKLDLDGYLAKVELLLSTYRAEAPAKLQKAIEGLRAELGIKENLNLIRAQKELAVPEITPERAKILSDYMASADKAEDDFRKTFKDAAYEKEMTEMKAEFGGLLTSLGVASIDDYKAKYDEYVAIKGKLSKEDERIRSTLAKLHQRYTRVMKEHRKLFDTTRDAILNALPRPEGIEDYGAALRESKADRSPERRAALQSFVERLPKLEAQVQEKSARELEESIAKIAVPEGVISLDDARAKKLEQDTLFNFTYVPAGDAELAALADEVKTLSAQYESSSPEIGKLEASVNELNGKRASLSRTWDGLWKKGILTSPRLKELDSVVETKLNHYSTLYFAYEHEKGLWEQGLKAQGQLNSTQLYNPPAALENQRKVMMAAKADFEQTRATVDSVRWQEALADRLEGPAGAVQEAKKAATALWGKDAANPAPESLMAQLRVQEETLEQKRRENSTMLQKLQRAQMDYSHLMIERGHQLPYTITRVNLREVLDLSYNDLVERLREDPVLAEAFRAAMERWSSYLSILRVEAQTKDTTSY